MVENIKYLFKYFVNFFLTSGMREKHGQTLILLGKVVFDLKSTFDAYQNSYCDQRYITNGEPTKLGPVFTKFVFHK